MSEKVVRPVYVLNKDASANVKNSDLRVDFTKGTEFSLFQCNFNKEGVNALKPMSFLDDPDWYKINGSDLEFLREEEL